jgi:hypothetical protein
VELIVELIVKLIVELIDPKGDGNLPSAVW